MAPDENYELNITNQIVDALDNAPDVYFFVNKERGMYEEIMIGHVLLEMQGAIRVSVMYNSIKQPLYSITDTDCRARLCAAIGRRHRRVRDAQENALSAGVMTPIARQFSNLLVDYKMDKMATKDAQERKQLAARYEQDRNKLIINLVRENAGLKK